ncbi:hypothetical protein LJB99_04505 [Deltaproteobacteria bacterium OttesenSCG-928-K17]|nr:hypothetical protein [Deltaproteobacteria bacterium OttesenSCG-928-K17]
MKALIIADDLTGAADTGVKFTACGPIDLINAGPRQGNALPQFSGGLNVSAACEDKSGLAPWGLAVATETRNAPAEDVPEALAGAAALSGDSPPDFIYKKIDSCLRGHVGLELKYLVENLSYRAALVAPAYPAFKRVTKNGLHYIDGRPVSETELANDPIRPVRDSRLAKVIADGHELPVHGLALELVRQGSQALLKEVERRLQSEERCLFALDAENDADLDIVAEAGLEAKDRLILAGSAGLAEALARRLSPGPPEADPAMPRRGNAPPQFSGGLDVSAGNGLDSPLTAIKRRPGPILFFGGSASETLREQLQRLALDWEAEILTLNPADLMAGREPAMPDVADGQTLVINLPRPGPRRGNAPPQLGGDLNVSAGNEHDSLLTAKQAPWSSLDLIAAFGRRAAAVIHQLKPGAIFLSGGDTARAVLEALDISRLHIKAEIRPGVVLLSHRDMAVVTKSGTFGEAGLLSEVRRLLG